MQLLHLLLGLLSQVGLAQTTVQHHSSFQQQYRAPSDRPHALLAGPAIPFEPDCSVLLEPLWCQNRPSMKPQDRSRVAGQNQFAAAYAPIPSLAGALYRAQQLPSDQPPSVQRANALGPPLVLPLMKPVSFLELSLS